MLSFNASNSCMPLLRTSGVHRVIVTDVVASDVHSCSDSQQFVVDVSGAGLVAQAQNFGGGKVLGGELSLDQMSTVTVERLNASYSDVGAVRVVSLLATTTAPFTAKHIVSVGSQSSNVTLPYAPIYVNGISSVTVDSFHVTNRSAASNGGCIHIYGATSVELRNGYLSDCHSGGNGGGAYVYVGCDVSAENLDVSECSAVGGGGGIAIEGYRGLTCEDRAVDTRFDDVWVVGNTAEGEGDLAIGGGGVLLRFVFATGDVAFISSVVNANHATGSSAVGGGIAVAGTYGVSTTLFSCGVAHNTATGGGGGIGSYVFTDPERRLAVGGGSVLLSQRAYLFMVLQSEFNWNTASGGDGGALLVLNGGAAVSTTTFAHNTAAGSGGAVAVSRSLARFTQVNLTANAAAVGGAMFVSSCLPGRVELLDAHVEGNEAAQVGGAFRVDRCQSGFIFERGAVCSNTAGGEHGGGFSIERSHATLDNVTVSACAALGSGSAGGAVFASDATVVASWLDAVNCSAGSGGAIAVQDGSELTVVNASVLSDGVATSGGGGALLCAGDSSVSLEEQGEVHFVDNTAAGIGQSMHSGGCVVQRTAAQVFSFSRLDGATVPDEVFAPGSESWPSVVAAGAPVVYTATAAAVTRSVESIVSGSDVAGGVMTVELRSGAGLVYFDDSTTCSVSIADKLDGVDCADGVGAWVPPQAPNTYVASGGVVVVDPFQVAVIPPASLCVSLHCGDHIAPVVVAVSVEQVTVAIVSTPQQVLPSSARRPVLYVAVLEVARDGSPLVGESLECSLGIVEAGEGVDDCVLAGSPVAQSSVADGRASISFGLGGPMGGTCAITASCDVGGGQVEEAPGQASIQMLNVTVAWDAVPGATLPSGGGTVIALDPPPSVKLLQRVAGAAEVDAVDVQAYNSGEEAVSCSLALRSVDDASTPTLSGAARAAADPGGGLIAWEERGIVADLGTLVELTATCTWYSGEVLSVPAVTVHVDSLSLSLSVATTAPLLPSTIAQPFYPGYSMAVLTLSRVSEAGALSPDASITGVPCHLEVGDPCKLVVASDATVVAGRAEVDFAASGPLGGECSIAATCAWFSKETVAAADALRFAVVEAEWLHGGSTLRTDSTAPLAPAPALRLTYFVDEGGGEGPGEPLPLPVSVPCVIAARVDGDGSARLSGATEAASSTDTAQAHFDGLAVSAPRGSRVNLTSRCIWRTGAVVEAPPLHADVYDYAVQVSAPAQRVLPSTPSAPLPASVNVSVARVRGPNDHGSDDDLALPCELRMAGSSCGLISTAQSQATTTRGAVALQFAVSASFGAVCTLRAVCTVITGERLDAETAVDVATVAVEWASPASYQSLPSGGGVVNALRPPPALLLTATGADGAAEPLIGTDALTCRADLPPEMLAVASLQGDVANTTVPDTATVTFANLGVAAALDSRVAVNFSCAWRTATVVASAPLVVDVASVVVEVEQAPPPTSLPAPSASAAYWSPAPAVRVVNALGALLDDGVSCAAVPETARGTLSLRGQLQGAVAGDAASWPQLGVSGALNDSLAFRFECMLSTGVVVRSARITVRTPALRLQWGAALPAGVTDRKPILPAPRVHLVNGDGSPFASAESPGAIRCVLRCVDSSNRAPLQVFHGAATVSVGVDGTAVWDDFAIRAGSALDVTMAVSCLVHSSLEVGDGVEAQLPVRLLTTAFAQLAPLELLPGGTSYPNIDTAKVRILDSDGVLLTSAAEPDDGGVAVAPLCRLRVSDAFVLDGSLAQSVPAALTGITSTNAVVGGVATFANLELSAPPGAVVELAADCNTATGVSATGGTATVTMLRITLDWLVPPPRHVLHDTQLAPLPRARVTMGDAGDYPNAAPPIFCVVEATRGGVSGQTRPAVHDSQLELAILLQRPDADEPGAETDPFDLSVSCNVIDQSLGALVASVSVERLRLQWEHQLVPSTSVLPSLGGNQFYVQPAPRVSMRNHTGLSVPVEATQETWCTVAALDDDDVSLVGGRTREPADELTGAATFSALTLRGDFGASVDIGVTCERGQGEKVGVAPAEGDAPGSVAPLPLRFHLKQAAMEIFTGPASVTIPTEIESRDTIVVRVRLFDAADGATLEEDSVTVCSASVAQVMLASGDVYPDGQFAFLDGARKTAIAGFVEFDGLRITAQVGSVVTIAFTCSLGGRPLLNDRQLSVAVRDCEPGYQPTSSGDDCALCPEGHYSDRGLEDCTECPSVGVECVEGGLSILPNYWVPPDVNGDIENSTVLYKCYNNEACTTNQTARTVQCSEGYTGVLCGVCAEGYAMQARSCTECWPDVLSWSIVCLVFAAIVAAIVYLTVIRPRNMDKEMRQLGEMGVIGALSVAGRAEEELGGDARARAAGKSRAKVAARIAVNYLQILFYLGRFTAHGTRTFRQIFDIGTVAASSPLEMGSFKCTLGLSFYDAWTIGMTLPVLAAALSSVIGIIDVVRMQFRRTQSFDGVLSSIGVWLKKRRYLGPVMLVMFFSYGGLNTGVVTMLACTPPIDGVQYHTDALEVPCYDRDHWAGIVFAIAATAVYSVGFPIGFTWYLRRRRHKLTDRNFQVNFGCALRPPQHTLPARNSCPGPCLTRVSVVVVALRSPVRGLLNCARPVLDGSAGDGAQGRYAHRGHHRGRPVPANHRRRDDHRRGAHPAHALQALRLDAVQPARVHRAVVPGAHADVLGAVPAHRDGRRAQRPAHRPAGGGHGGDGAHFGARGAQLLRAAVPRRRLRAPLLVRAAVLVRGAGALPGRAPPAQAHPQEEAPHARQPPRSRRCRARRHVGCPGLRAGAGRRPRRRRDRRCGRRRGRRRRRQRRRLGVVHHEEPAVGPLGGAKGARQRRARGGWRRPRSEWCVRRRRPRRQRQRRQQQQQRRRCRRPADRAAGLPALGGARRRGGGARAPREAAPQHARRRVARRRSTRRGRGGERRQGAPRVQGARRAPRGELRQGARARAAAQRHARQPRQRRRWAGAAADWCAAGGAGSGFRHVDGQPHACAALSANGTRAGARRRQKGRHRAPQRRVVCTDPRECISLVCDCVAQTALASPRHIAKQAKSYCASIITSHRSIDRGLRQSNCSCHSHPSAVNG